MEAIEELCKQNTLSPAISQNLLPMYSYALVRSSVHDYDTLEAKLKTAMKGAETWP